MMMATQAFITKEVQHTKCLFMASALLMKILKLLTRSNMTGFFKAKTSKIEDHSHPGINSQRITVMRVEKKNQIPFMSLIQFSRLLSDLIIY